MGEDPRLYGPAQVAVVGVDFHRNLRFGAPKLIVLFVPEVGVIPLLNQLWHLRELLVLFEDIEVGWDQVVHWREVQNLSFKLDVWVHYFLKKSRREVFHLVLCAIPLLYLICLVIKRF